MPGGAGLPRLTASLGVTLTCPNGELALPVNTADVGLGTASGGGALGGLGGGTLLDGLARSDGRLGTTIPNILVGSGSFTGGGGAFGGGSFSTGTPVVLLIGGAVAFAGGGGAPDGGHCIGGGGRI